MRLAARIFGLFAGALPAGAAPAQMLAITEARVYASATAAPLARALALRRRIDSVEIPGPRILTAGMPIYPPEGVPYYVKETVPPEVLRMIAPARDAQGAAAIAAANLQNGADFVKLSTGSWVSHEKVMVMPEAIAAAVARHMALIPTLKLFSGADNIADIRGPCAGSMNSAAS